MAKNALETIIESKKLPVLFIGSGISRRYLYHFPDWESLLKSSFYKVHKDSYYYQNHFDKLKRQGLNTFEINKELGSIIENDFNEAFYQRKIKIKTENPNWASTGVSPYKMYLSQKFKKLNIYHTDWVMNEIDEFKKLKNKVSAVITTNYDQLIEKILFDTDFTVYKHQYEMFSADSYNIAEIYKIHGCVTDADSIVITNNDYQFFEESRKLFIAKMLTLFAESPIIFLGYSFTDENIQKIVLDFLNCLSPKDIETIHEHLIFISWKKGEYDIKEIHRVITTKNGKQIPITELQTDNYLLVYQTLNKITPGISPVKVRETRRIVKRIVDKSLSQGNNTALIVGIDDLDRISETKDLAIAIGYREDFISKSGYRDFPETVIIEDILKDNQNLDSKSVCFDRYRSISPQRVLPIFKYAKDISENIDCESKIYKYIQSKNSKDKIISNTIQKTIKNYPVVNNSDELKAKLSTFEDINKKCMFILKNINILSSYELRELLIDMFDAFSLDPNKYTQYKRCVLYLDFLDYYPIFQKKSSICNS